MTTPEDLPQNVEGDGRRRYYIAGRGRDREKAQKALEVLEYVGAGPRDADMDDTVIDILHNLMQEIEKLKGGNTATDQ